MTTSTVAKLMLAAALGLAGGCAEGGAFPSLAPRAVERLSMDDPVRTPSLVAASPALAARIAELVVRARQGQASFEAELPLARAEVGRAGAPGSDSWIEAQQAISRLEGAGAATADALAQLDGLSVEQAERPTNAADFKTLLGAVEAVQTIADLQKAEIDRLQGALRPI